MPDLLTKDKKSNGGGMMIRAMGVSWTDSGGKGPKNWSRDDSRSQGSYEFTPFFRNLTPAASQSVSHGFIATYR